MSIYARGYFFIIYLYVKRMTHTREQWTPQAMRRTNLNPTEVLPSTDCPPLANAELTSVVDRHWGASCNKNKHGADCCAAVSVANPIAAVAAAALNVWTTEEADERVFVDRRPKVFEICTKTLVFVSFLLLISRPCYYCKLFFSFAFTIYAIYTTRFFAMCSV